MGFRFILLVLLFTSLYGLLGLQLYRIQIVQSGVFKEKIEASEKFNTKLALRRGQIFFRDKNQKLIAVSQNRDKPIIFASPEEIKDPKTVSKLLASIVNREESALTKILSKPKSFFEPLVEEPTKEQM